VYVADPGIVKQVFTGDPSLFHAGEANATVLEPTLGPSSVLTLDDDEHLRQRKLLLPPFHGESVSRYGELIREITERDMKSWPIGQPFALRPHTQRITLAVILRAVFGVRDEERFKRASALVDEFARKADLITQLPLLRRDLGRFGPWARFKRARAALDEFIYEEIATRRTEVGGGEHDDVLSLLLHATHDDGTPMSDRELRDELVTVVGAGHETTATALAWALERVLRTPRVLSRLRASIKAGEDDYLDAAIKETLRARPVIVDVARKLTGPAEIGGYERAGRHVRPSGNRRAPPPRGPLSGPARVPPRALPRREGGPLRVDTLRWRSAPLHRGGLCPVRDARGARGDPRTGGAEGARLTTGTGEDSQRHAGAGRGLPRGARVPAVN